MNTEASVRVMDRLGAPSTGLKTNKILFVLPDEDEPGLYVSSLMLEADTWRAMGEPEQITVTVQPGDKLTEPAVTGRIWVVPRVTTTGPDGDGTVTVSVDGQHAGYFNRPEWAPRRDSV